MKPCPRCDEPLGETAIACACGWKDRKASKKAELPPLRVPCAHETCAQLAFSRIRTELGWANLCDEHYSLYFLEKAKKTCDSLGLDTIAKKREWVKENVGKLQLKMTPFYLREPGEDENYGQNA